MHPSPLLPSISICLSNNLFRFILSAQTSYSSEMCSNNPSQDSTMRMETSTQLFLRMRSMEAPILQITSQYYRCHSDVGLVSLDFAHSCAFYNQKNMLHKYKIHFKYIEYWNVFYCLQTPVLLLDEALAAGWFPHLIIGCNGFISSPLHPSCCLTRPPASASKMHSSSGVETGCISTANQCYRYQGNVWWLFQARQRDNRIHKENKWHEIHKGIRR